MDVFRELLEGGSYCLTSVPNMRQLIPFVRKEEEEMIKGEISGHNVSVIFDGTTRLGEALAIVVRFITADWEIKQRLVRLQLIAKSLKGDELAREIITVLAQQYNVQNSSLCGAMRDGASVNGAAMRTVKVVFPKVVDVRCFSHAIDGIGSHFNIPHSGASYSSGMPCLAIVPQLELRGKSVRASQTNPIPQRGSGAGGR